MAARIPDQLKREIVDRTDMAAVVGEDVVLRRAGSSIKGLCPFHGEKTPSFTINTATKVYFCHGCQAGGDVISFVREIRGLNFIEALEHLAERAGIEIVREEMSPEEQHRQKAERSQRGRLLDLNRAAQSFFQAQLRGQAGELARAYVAERGLKPETCQTFGVGFAPDSWDALLNHLRRNGFDEVDIEQVGLAKRSRDGGKLYDRFRNRLMYPVYQNRDDIVAFGGRRLDGERNIAKYMNSPEAELTEVEGRYNSALWKFYKKSNCVFGLAQAQRGIRKHKMAIIVEGNLDVMSLHQAGLDYTVCSMGTALTDGQMHEIKRFTDHVVLILDGDKAGRKAALKSVPLILAAGLDGKRVELPDGDDPDDFVRREGAQALRDRIDSAPGLLRSFIDDHVAAWDGGIVGKSRLLQQIGPILATIPDPIARDMAKDYLGTRMLSPRIEDNREAMDRYLRQVAPSAGSTSARRQTPPADALAAIPPLESELVRVVMWFPELLLEVKRGGDLDHISHHELNWTLRLLADRQAKYDDVTQAGLTANVEDLNEGPIRRALLQLLVQPAHMSGDEAAACLKQVRNQLKISSLRKKLAEALANCQTAGDKPTLEMWARIAMDIRRNIELLT